MWTNKDLTTTKSGLPFSSPQQEKSKWNFYSSPPYCRRPLSEKKPTPPRNKNNLFHVIHKVPAGDSPYVRAKHVQLVENNPSKAVSLFWAAINSGDRVDSALKDMAVVMKQLNRSDEAIEAIKSFRHLCPQDAQGSLDNILLELYKRSGRIEEQIELLQIKLKHIEETTSIDGNPMKFARSHRKRIQITVGQEYTRLLGNLAWAHLQQDQYKIAEEIYRKALSLEPDKNKKCNLAICLMYTGKMTEARFLLSTVKNLNRSEDVDEESYAKSYERAIQVMDELEMEKTCDTVNQTSFSSFLSRNKETNSIEELAKGKRGDSDPRFNKSHVSPSAASNTPRVPVTQPRRQYWERDESVVGCVRKLHFEKTAKVRREPSVDCTPETISPVRESEMSVVQKVITNAKTKKSWADMVEEDEQNMNEYGAENDEQNWLKSTRSYCDENEDCNIMKLKIDSMNIQDGPQTQPGSATCGRNKMVKRSLTFDRTQNLNEDENYRCSLSVQKENAGYESSELSLAAFEQQKLYTSSMFFRI